MTDVIFEPAPTTHWKTLFAQKNLLLGSHNLNPGEELIATISEVGIQKIKGSAGEEEQVPVLRFENAPPAALNITNSRIIASLYGDHYAGWIGKRIQIYVARVRGFGGDEVDGLRVRKFIPRGGDDERSKWEDTLHACTSMAKLKKAFMAAPRHLQRDLAGLKDEMKEQLS